MTKMITSKDNEKLKLIRKLRSRKWREREGLFVTEGEDLLAAGLRAGAEPEEVLVAAGSGLEGDQVDPTLLDGVSELGSGTRLVAIWPIVAGAPAATPGGATVYLHEVGDPGNVGAVIRSAAALGCGRVVLGPGCADPWGPKAVRASMGAIFAVPPARGEVGDLPVPRVALVAHGGGGESGLDGAATLVLGGERDGVPPDVLADCDRTVTIAVRPDAVESLNVAATAAIALHRISSAAAEGGAEGKS